MFLFKHFTAVLQVLFGTVLVQNQSSLIKKNFTHNIIHHCSHLKDNLPKQTFALKQPPTKYFPK